MNLVMASTASCTAVCCAIKCVGFSGFFSTWYAVHLEQKKNYILSRKIMGIGNIRKRKGVKKKVPMQESNPRPLNLQPAITTT